MRFTRAALFAAGALALACTEHVATEPRIDKSTDEPTLTRAPLASGNRFEPLGYSVAAQRAFAAKARNAKDGAGAEGWDASEYQYKTLSVVADRSAPRSSPSVMQVAVRRGSRGGETLARVGKALPADTRQLYASLWFKLSDSWRGEGTLAQLRIGGAPRLTIGFDQAAAAGPAIAATVVPTTAVGRASARPVTFTGTSGAIARGQWHRLELVAKSNTAGTADGLLDVWVDGVPAITAKSLRFIAKGESDSWQRVDLAPSWGGNGGSAPADMYMYWDHAYVSGSSSTTDPVFASATALAAAATDNVIFSDDFESGDLSVWQDGVNPTKHQIVNDASLAHSGTHSLQMTYPAGQSGGWLTRFFMPGYDSVYVSYWVRLDPTWSGSTALLSVRGSRIDDQWSAFGKSGVCPSGTDFFSTSVFAGASTNPLDLSFSTYFPGMAPSGTTGCSGLTQGPATTYAASRRLTAGDWHRIELWVKLNAVGSSDGVERMWLDGQLAGEWTGLTLRTDAILALNSLMLDGAATAPQTQHLYIDDVQVLPAMPGTEPPPPPPPAPVAAVAVTVSASTLTVGQTTQAVARLTDAAGNVLVNRAIAWSSSSSATATVDSTGLVTAIAVGAATITATAEGIAGSVPVSVTPVPVASVHVTLNAPSLTIGQSTQATAALADAGGNALTGRVVTWTSTNPGVATVSASGLVTSVAAGSSSITATSEGVSGSAPLTVTAPPPPVDNAIFSENFESGSLAPWQDGVNTSKQQILNDGSLAHSGTHVLQVTYPAGQSGGWLTRFFMPGYDSLFVSYWVRLDPAWVGSTSLLALRGSRTDDQWSAFGKGGVCPSGSDFFSSTVTTGSLGGVTAGDPLDLWFSSAYVGMPRTATGTCQGVAQGTGVTTYASSRRLTAGVWHNVAFWVKLNTTGQNDALQRIWLDGQLVGEWSGFAFRTDPAVRLNSLMLDGYAIASQTQKLFIDDVVVSPTLPSSITPPPPPPPPAPVASVAVTLNSNTLDVGQATQAVAALRDASGNVLTGRIITWSSSNAAAASVDANGLVRAVNAGTATITATSEGVAGSATITVKTPAPPPPAAVASVTVSLAASDLVAGATTQASAVLRDSTGSVLTGRTIVWSSSSSAVATVDANGLVSSVSPGTTNIVATSEGITGQATLSVTAAPPPPVASVAVTLSPNSLTAGQTVQATTVLKDASGNVLSGRTITWSSSNAAAATVNGTGLVTAVAVGTSTITATSEGINGTATVTVTLVPVASVTVTLNAPSLTAGQSTQATAVTKDAGGNVLTGRAVTWSSSNTAVATVSSTGLVQAVAAGTAAIRATSGSIVGSANLTVTAAAPAPVATVTLSPASVSLTMGGTQQFTPTLKDVSGNTLTGRTITWSSSAPGVASVNGSGLVTALAVGSATISATSETKIGSASVTVTTVVSPGPGVPVYDPSNPDHVLHVFEDWSTYSTAADIGRVNRVDGGGPWTNDSPSFKSFSTNNNDPWFGKKTLDIDYQQGPGAGQSEGHGLNLEQNTPERYLNTSQAKASLVIEWAWRFSGTQAYVGKFADWQPFAGTDRFNYQLSYDPMGAQGSSCNSDPLCSKYYANNGTTPLLPGLMPTAKTEGMQFARSMNLNTSFYTQNRNYGRGAGQVSWGGQGETMLDNQWRRTILRLTLNANGVMGQGRLEEWLQLAGQPAVKVMEYIGDVGGFDQGLVNGRNGNSWFTDSSILHWYNLSAVAGIFDGGSTVHVGYFRMWSESRP